MIRIGDNGRYTESHGDQCQCGKIRQVVGISACNYDPNPHALVKWWVILAVDGSKRSMRAHCVERPATPEEVRRAIAIGGYNAFPDLTQSFLESHTHARR